MSVLEYTPTALFPTSLVTMKDKAATVNVLSTQIDQIQSNWIARTTFGKFVALVEFAQPSAEPIDTEIAVDKAIDELIDYVNGQMDVVCKFEVDEIKLNDQRQIQIAPNQHLVFVTYYGSTWVDPDEYDDEIPGESDWIAYTIAQAPLL